MDMKELSSILQQNGIVGAGGAGFPTYAKLDERAETIILNCAECEPLLRLHRQLLEKYAKEIIDTFHMIGETVGAKEVIIGIKKAYTATIEAVKAVMGQYPEVRLGLLLMNFASILNVLFFFAQFSSARYIARGPRSLPPIPI